ncbi:MAG: ATP-dependent 6-phosphofructokinase [Desulfovibrionales bacterium]
MPDRKKESGDRTIIDHNIPTLGPAKIKSPLPLSFIQDTAGVLIHIRADCEKGICDINPSYFQEAGPREKIYFDPPKTKCAIVSSGGLCPGTNDVIRAIVMEAKHAYGVHTILGIRYGLEGFIPKYGHEVMELTPENVASIHEFGGTILGSSRGPQPPVEIADTLERMNISSLFLIGGDGTMRAAEKIQKEVGKRGLKISIIGIPKTIDNDIKFISRSFGFDTAVEKATEAIRSAHTEALGACNGVGLVKVMGREAGFIAAQAALALKDVNFVLVPEDPFDIHGPNGLLQVLEKRLERRKHAVIVVAEGAGHDLVQSSGTDASGNPVLGDISGLLISEIKQYFKDKNIPLTLKFIDPSYIIRSVPANSNDRVYCGFLGQNAVHAAMAGKTGAVVSKLHGKYVHIPLHLVTSGRKRLDPHSNYWQSIVESTGQPISLKNPPEQSPAKEEK